MTIIDQTAVFDSALQLLTRVGVATCSLEKIAENTGIPEAILREEFEDETALLQAILEEGSKKATHYITEIASNEDPKEVIRGFLELPFRINEAEHDFWRLVYTLKWQQHQHYFDSSKVFMGLATKAFDQLGYSYPAAEAETLIMVLDGIATAVLLKTGNENRALTLTCLRAKYQL